jgi:hypothetical protein
VLIRPSFRSFDERRARTRQARRTRTPYVARVRRVRADKDCIYINNAHPSFPYARLRRTSATLWQLEKLGGRGSVLRWVGRSGRTTLEKLTSRWNDPELLDEDVGSPADMHVFADAAQRRAEGLEPVPAEVPVLRADSVFPRMRLNEKFWAGSDTLEPWQGFVCRWDGDGRRVRGKPPARFRLTVTDPQGTGPSAAQRKAYAYLKANQGRIGKLVNTRLVAHYRELDLLSAADDTDPGIRRMLAPISSAAGLRERIELRDVLVCQKARNGFAYIGFLFRCVWDFEHGLCVKISRSRIVEIGGADVAL